MRIAVLVNRYPSVTHSFIRREIQGLELAGIEVLRVSIARDPDPLVDPADREEARRTRGVLAHGVAGLLASLAAVAATRPRACARAAALAIAFAREGDRGLLRHLAYLTEACVLLRWCEAEAIDHVHAHFGTNACAVAALLRALGGPRFSFVVHGPEEFERPLGLERKRACAAFVVAASEHCRRELEQRTHRASATPVHVVRCGVGSAFLDAPPSEAPTAPRLVCVGRLVERKGHALLLEALAQLAREGVSCTLSLVGDGPLRGALEARCAELGLQGAVRFRGWASEDEVLRDIVAARVLVLPSFAEGLPVVLMEALALGRPVVCTDIAGHSELVENGVSGWLIPVGSLAALVAALREVLALAPAELSRRGRAGRARVASLHDARREAARLAELLRASARSLPESGTRPALTPRA
jgi:glycosyltransferase involved in cell wall biosynthesis